MLSITLTNLVKFAQELLSTFSTSLGEVSLIPATGGVFTVDIVHAAPQSDQGAVNEQSLITQTTRIWDRKAEGGFPGTSLKVPAVLFVASTR